MKLKDRTILITGGTSGIGRALAEMLKKDNTVIVTGRRQLSVQKAREEELHAFPLDLSSKESMDALAVYIETNYPALDLLINNAGVQHNYNFTTATDTYDAVNGEIAINLTGQIYLTQLLLPLLSTRPSAIVNVTSALGAVPKSDGLVYSASKAGLRNFTRGLRKVLKGTSVQVLECIPPVTDTAMTAGRDEAKMTPKELANRVLGQMKKRFQVLAPQKIKFFLWLNRMVPRLADKIIP